MGQLMARTLEERKGFNNVPGGGGPGRARPEPAHEQPIGACSRDRTPGEVGSRLVGGVQAGSTLLLLPTASYVGCYLSYTSIDRHQSGYPGRS